MSFIIKNNNKTVLYILLFTTIFLSGADLLSFNVNGYSIRFFYIYIATVFLTFIGRFKYRTGYITVSLFFLITLIPSIYYSLSPMKSFFSTIMLFMNIFIVVGFIHMAILELNLNRDSLIRIIIYVYRVQITFSILFVVFGITERAQFFYYEPSYMGLSLVLYTSAIFCNAMSGKSIKLDILFALAFLCFSFSAIFLLSVFIVSLIYMTMLKPRYMLLFLLLLGSILVAYIFIIDDLNTLAIRNFLNGNIDFEQLILRGGNRISRILSAIDVFLLHPFFGVGFNAYEEYSIIKGINDYSGGIEYLTAKGLPAINIYIELMATSGIVGLLGFFILVVYICFLSRKKKSPFFIAILSMLLMLNFESSIMRPYFWVAVALALSDYSSKIKDKYSHTMVKSNV
ncbi:O-antigen ligase family protein [Photorhabdus viridis]|uniref:O-antigen ligase family protein n=1 Tax=Photorhabdus viridis TaxID=3163327 RepID=UPI0033076E5A